MKKILKKIALLSLVGAGCLMTFASCAAGSGPLYGSPDSELPGNDEIDGSLPNYNYGEVVEQDFKKTSEENSSYFTLDRNTANYSLVRAQLNAGSLPSYDSIRTEELINYFSYDYPEPEEGEVMKASAYLSDCPWNENNKLMTIGVKTRNIQVESEKNNYVFLVDISGSMSGRVQGLEGTSKLDLVKYSINQAVDGLGENDSVSIVVYASGVEVKLVPTYATEEGKTAIRQQVSKLNAYGSTNGSGGLELAYEQAVKNYSEGGNNRVILMSDGDFNVGRSNLTDLKEFIQEKAKTGVYLSVLGYGLGNTRDDLMQELALNGNGNYAYIDSTAEAQKVLKTELNGMLTAVAKDAKAGVTFSESTVDSYRIIGYDMKMITEDDFNNEDKDAGEIGSNLCVTIMYELVPTVQCAENEKLADVAIRFKNVFDNEKNEEINVSVLNANKVTDDTVFSSCVAEFGLLLRRSKYMGTANYDSVISRLESIKSYVEKDLFKSEFEELVIKAKGLNKTDII